MPYSIRKGGGTCKPGQYAVVKTSTGESVGCHSDQGSAKRHLAALYANVKEAGHPAYRYRHGWIPLNPTAFAAQVQRDSKAAAAAKISAARQAEPHLTSTMQKLATTHGGHLAGLDFRLKTEDSLARKIASRVQETKPPPPTTPAQVAEQMFDVNRYTTVFSDADYASKSTAALDSLRGQGYTLKVKNYWTVPDNPYKGINVQVKSPDGHQFELQFHTPKSLAVKEGEIHRLYELRRVETDPAKAARLDAEMFTVSASIPDPPKVQVVEADNRYTPVEQEAGSVEVRETAVISERSAATAKTTGKMLVQFISPGWGTSGYYSPEVLAEAVGNRVIPAGTHMYADHPTEDEDRKRPERSIRDLMAVTTSDAQLSPDGALVGEVRVLAPYAPLIEDLKDHIGVSIRGDATDVTEGLAEGRRGRIIEGLAHVSSVDFVTRPGRGGQVLQLLESANVGDDYIDPQLQEALAELAGRGNAETLRRYWTEGEGAGKIKWGVAGDFDRCVRHLSKYVADAKGYCSDMHQRATGARPGHAAGESDVPATRPDSTTTIEETTEVTMGNKQIEESEYTRLVEDAGRVDTLTSERDTEKARAETAEARLAEVEAKLATATPPTPAKETPAASRNPRQLIEAQLAEQRTEIQALKAREQAVDIVNEELGEAWVAPSTVARLTSEMLRDLPLAEGKLDESALRGRCVEARSRAELEAAETLDAAGFGTPRGVGGLTTSAAGTTPEKYTEEIAEGFQTFGLTEAEATAAAKGR